VQRTGGSHRVDVAQPDGSRRSGHRGGLELQSITRILGGTSLFGAGAASSVRWANAAAQPDRQSACGLNVNQWIQGLIQGIIIIAVALYKQEGRQ
jgi:ribose/xylose/arabinose/galactoside ABC-type transport system permease subunit